MCQKVFAALVRYLRSGGVPFKQRVVSLLTQLVQGHRHFAASDPPPLALLSGVAGLVRDRADLIARVSREGRRRAEEEASPRLQALVELVVAAQAAARDASARHSRPLTQSLASPSQVLQLASSAPASTTAGASGTSSDEAVSDADGSVTSSLLPPAMPFFRTDAGAAGQLVEVALPPHESRTVELADSIKEALPVALSLAPVPEDQSALDVLTDVLECASALLEKRVPPLPLLCEAFARAVSVARTVHESARQGQVVFEGARELVVRVECIDAQVSIWGRGFLKAKELCNRRRS